MFVRSKPSTAFWTISLLAAVTNLMGCKPPPPPPPAAPAIRFVTGGQGDPNGNHSPETQVDAGGDRWSTALAPVPAKVLGPGATPAELAILARDYPPPVPAGVGPGAPPRKPGWVFSNGPSLGGTLVVTHYDAYENPPMSPADTFNPKSCDNPIGDDCFRLTFTTTGHVNPAAPNKLRWIQFVCTDSPAAGGKVCPPAANAYVDPFTPDDDLPFYWTEAEEALVNHGAIPSMFADQPSRHFPATLATITWDAHVYLADWNGVTPDRTDPTGKDGVVVIHDGVDWGFVLTCLQRGQPPGTWVEGGVDRDKWTTEKNGIVPPGPPGAGCKGEQAPHASPTHVTN